MTPPETKLCTLLRANRLGVKFVRQMVVEPYIADFAARADKLIIELDGDSHATQLAYDAAHTRSFEDRGFRVIRFSNRDVMTNPEGVVRAILIALGRDFS